MAFQSRNKFKGIINTNTLLESDRYGFSKKKLPKIVNEPVKISHNNANYYEKNVIRNYSKKTINYNGAEKKVLANLKYNKNTINHSGIINTGINNNGKMNNLSTINTQSNSITRIESEISFTDKILNNNKINRSFTQSEKKKGKKLKIDSSEPRIHTSKSISKKGDKVLIYGNTEGNLNERYRQEIKAINNYLKKEDKEIKKKPKLDAINFSNVNKNIDRTKKTSQNEEDIKKKEDNQIKDGANDEIKKETKIKNNQNEICDNNNNNIKGETEIKLDENKIDEINDNLRTDIKIKHERNSTIDNKNIKKDIEFKPEKNSIIGNNSNIKTETEVKLDQNNIGNSSNKKTDTEVKLDQNNIGNSSNKKTDTEIKLDQNNIGVNDEKESETKILLEKALANEKQLKRNNTLEKINLLIMKKNNKNKRGSSSCDIKNINQNRNNDYLNSNKNYVCNNYCSNKNVNNCYLPNINRSNGNCNNYNLYNNYNFYYNNKHLNNNQFNNNYNFYSNNNFYNS